MRRPDRQEPQPHRIDAARARRIVRESLGRGTGTRGAAGPAAASGSGSAIVAKPPASTASSGVSRWFNPATAPFIPIPEVAADPDNGTTVGLIPTWLKTDEHHDIRQIIAPDIIHNPYFGYGVHGRIYDYPSTDEQWSLIGGIKQRVERSIDGEYQTGRLRDRRWSVNLSVVYDRDGTFRFYGIGNHSAADAQTNFTGEQEVLQAQIGLNLTHAWQLQYTLRMRSYDVLPGTLPGIPSIYTLFPDVQGLHTTKELLHRVAIVYDTRDDVTVPTRGMEWVVYGGTREPGGPSQRFAVQRDRDRRPVFWPIARNSILAVHTALGTCRRPGMPRSGRSAPSAAARA